MRHPTTCQIRNCKDSSCSWNTNLLKRIHHDLDHNFEVNYDLVVKYSTWSMVTVNPASEWVHVHSKSKVFTARCREASQSSNHFYRPWWYRVTTCSLHAMHPYPQFLTTVPVPPVQWWYGDVIAGRPYSHLWWDMNAPSPYHHWYGNALLPPVL